MVIVAEAVVNAVNVAEAVVNAAIVAEAVVNAAIAVEAVANAGIAVEAVANAAIAVEAVVNAAIVAEAVVNAAIAVEAVANAGIVAEAVVNAATAVEAVANVLNVAIVAVAVYVVTVVKAVSVVTVVDAAMLTAAPARAVMGLAAEVHVGLASAASLLSAAPWNFVPDAALTGAVLAANVSLVPQSVVARIVVIAAVGASARKRRRNVFVGVIIRISNRKTIIRMRNFRSPHTTLALKYFNPIYMEYGKTTGDTGNLRKRMISS